MEKDFVKNFLSSVKPKQMVNAEALPEMLIPVIYHYNLPSFQDRGYDSYFHLLGGGMIQADFPFGFTFRKSDFHILLYTEQGGGKISVGSKTLSSAGNTLLLLQSQAPFSMLSSVLPWNFYIFFFQGTSMELYTPFLPHSVGSLFDCNEIPSARQDIHNLLRIPPQIDERRLLSMHQTLGTLLSSMAFLSLPAEAPPLAGLPHYVVQLKAALDTHYASPFSLEYYEKLYQISRYRLCRDFSQAFHTPPLRYLTEKRISAAKKLLLTTDLSIQQISNRVGYDNVNHFIHLFKKNTGETPGVFRQKG